MVGHAVRLCERPVEELLRTSRFESYVQVYSQTCEQRLFAGERDLLDQAAALYLRVSGGRLVESLPLSRFWRVLDCCAKIGKKPVKRLDFELVYKKLTADGRPMDFPLFWAALAALVAAFDDCAFASLRKKLDRFFLAAAPRADR